MRSEATDLEITTDVPATIGAIDRFERALLRHGCDTHMIVAAADADPDCALVNALAAATLLSVEAQEEASPYLAAMIAATPQATDRERLFVRGVAASAAGRRDAAIAAYLEIAHRWPRDLVSAKLCQLHQLESGDAAGMLRTAHLMLPANGDNHFAYGMLAFALAQGHDADGAEAAARQALAMSLDDPWAHHALAHVFAARRQAADGLAWLERHVDVWAGCGLGLAVHMWRHLAFCHIDLDDRQEALRIYDERVVPACEDGVTSQIDALSLLARLELEGYHVGGRWAALATRLDARLNERVIDLRDLHASYGLVRIDRDRRLAARRAARSIDIDGGAEVVPLARWQAG